MNRELAKDDQAPVNRKRVHRIMQRHALLLERHTGRRVGRTHDGTIMVMRSNLRWCSDGLEFSCWNGDVIRIAFIIDAFDREILAWTAVCGVGISGADVRDMMLDAVERRFGAVRAPHPIEHLSDNGSPYTAKQTRDFAAALNLVPCFTPVRSPDRTAWRRPSSNPSSAIMFASIPCRMPRRCSGRSPDGSMITTRFIHTLRSRCAPHGVHPSSGPIASVSGETGGTPLTGPGTQNL